MIMAADEDPRHPDFVATKTFANFNAMGGKNFPSWNDAVFDMKITDRVWKFAFANSGSTPADLRQCASGVFDVISQTTVPANTALGILYLETEIEFCDVAPTFTSITVNLDHGHTVGDWAKRERDLRLQQLRKDLASIDGGGLFEKKEVEPEWVTTDPVGRVVDYITPYVPDVREHRAMQQPPSSPTGSTASNRARSQPPTASPAARRV